MIKVLISLLFLLFLNIKDIKSNNKLFKNFFKKVEIINLQQNREIQLSSIVKLRIDESDNIWIIDARNRNIKKFDKKGNLTDSFGRRGKGPEEFEFPIGIYVDKNYVYVCDLGLRVVKKFNRNNKKLIRSFYIGSCRDIKVNSKNEIFIAGFHYIKEKEGFFIRKFNHNGILINSFLSPNEKFYKLNMRLADAFFDFDKEENIFAALAITYEIYKFNADGKLQNVIKNPNSKYIFPPDKLPEYSRFPSIMREWYKKWSYIDNILVLKNKILIISFILYDKRKYSIDIFDKDGKLIAQNILTSHRLMSKDTEDNLYFHSNQFSNRDERKYEIGKYKILLKK
ncbi:MAG: 6-bladed beta-propeller [Acidobacteriota bacterium]